MGSSRADQAQDSGRVSDSRQPAPLHPGMHPAPFLVRLGTNAAGVPPGQSPTPCPVELTPGLRPESLRSCSVLTSAQGTGHHGQQVLSRRACGAGWARSRSEGPPRFSALDSSGPVGWAGQRLREATRPGGGLCPAAGRTAPGASGTGRGRGTDRCVCAGPLTGSVWRGGGLRPRLDGTLSGLGCGFLDQRQWGPGWCPGWQLGLRGDLMVGWRGAGGQPRTET